MKVSLLAAFLLAIPLAACGGGDASPASGTEPADDPIVGVSVSPDLPIQEALVLDPIDPALAAVGEADYTTSCTTCHKLDERYVGPPLGDVITRRSPEWIMNMILAPDKMIVSDPDARALFTEYNGIPMTNQNLTQERARAILEYLRQTAEGS